MKNHFRYTDTAFISFVFAVPASAMLFPVLYHFFPAGIGIFICTALFYAAILLAMRGRYSLKRRKNWLLFFPIGLCALQFAFFNNGLLSFCNLVALVVLISIQLALMTGMTQSIFARSTLPMVIHTAFVRPFHRIGALYANAFAHKNKKTKKAIGAIFAGIAVTLPILAILLLLLTSADIVFAEFISNIFSWKSLWRIIYFVLLIAAFFTMTGSFVVSLKEKTHLKLPPKKGHRDFPLVMVYILTVSLGVLMIFFCAFQFLYLTGLSELPYDFSYSTYARQGFFQMLAAAALVFFVIILCHRRTVNAVGTDRLILNIIYTTLTVSVIVLLVSSFSRMVLYEQVYRFTRLRLYTQAFTILLGAVSILTIVKIWKPRFRFARGVFLAITGALILLTFFNVDGFIAKDAVGQAKKHNTAPDLAYLSTLSVDAIPYYAEYLNPAMFDINEPYAVDFYESVSDAEMDAYYDTVNLAYRLESKVSRLKQEDLRTYNRTRALVAARVSDDVLSSARNLIRRAND